MALYQGPRAQIVRFCLLHLYLAGRCCENLQSAWGSAQCKYGQGNNVVSRRNHLLYIFQSQFTSISPVFTRQNAFEKN